MILKEPAECIVLWKARITQNISLKITEEEMQHGAFKERKFYSV